MSDTPTPRRVSASCALSSLTLSRFNARQTRGAAAITRLAERMQRNGFEVTRALWVLPVGEQYEVFAGGTRLAAAREAGLSEVPCLVHVDYTVEMISRLADEDNENDEYHVPVPLPDVWAEYKRLNKEEGWTQEDIAKSKGKSEGLVAERIKYAGFPKSVLETFLTTPLLGDSHARELAKVSQCEDCTPWLTRDQALTEIVAGVMEKHRGPTAGIAPTASVFAKAVATWNTMLAAAMTTRGALPEVVETTTEPYHPRAEFLLALAADTVRTTKDVELVADQIRAHLQALEYNRLVFLEAEQQRLTAEQAAVARRAQELELERQRHAYRARVLRCLAHGDCRVLIPTFCPAEIRLVLTDPPYGKHFQSQRRVTSGRRAVIDGDASLAAAVALVREALTAVQPKLAEDAHLVLFTHQDSYRAMCTMIEEVGFTLRRTMTWCKGNHGLGDTTRAEVLTETEWLIHAVQGNPKFTELVARAELLDFPGEQDSEHPLEKPLALLQHLIGLTTEPGQLVVDPFAGTANTLLATLTTHRWGWACEVDETFYQAGAEKLYHWLDPRAEEGT